ncbi:MAG TPA: 2-oxo acid dehydrogenase subunit E2 [Anaerolineaceae bacterium]
MATDLFIPKLGQTVEEVTIVDWLVEDGETVDYGQGVLDVETDKAVFPVEANAKGILHRGPYKKGDVLPVLTVVAVIGKPEDGFQLSVPTHTDQGIPVAHEVSAVTPIKEPPATVSVPEEIFASPRARRLAKEKHVDLALVQPTGYGGVRVAERDVLAYLVNQPPQPAIQPPKATPLAQKVAAETGIDLQTVSGSGPRGRIMREDVERASAPAAPIGVMLPALPPMEISERIPLKGVRGLIAERMGVSVHTTARVTLMMEVDATEFVAMRTRLKQRVEQEWGFAPGFNDLLAKIAAAALRKFPYMNARLASDAIERLAQVNVGIAVDTERGLLVPVVRDADKISLRAFGADFRAKVERARAGRSLPGDLAGGTFTITNLGMYDVEAFTPVINLPEAAILGVGKIIAKPVVRGDNIVIRQMMTLSLVFDHRLVDGAPAARFMQYIKQVIEEPYLLLAE